MFLVEQDVLMCFYFREPQTLFLKSSCRQSLEHLHHLLPTSNANLTWRNRSFRKTSKWLGNFPLPQIPWDFGSQLRSCKIGQQAQSPILQSWTTGPWVGSSHRGRSSGTQSWWKRSGQIADQQVWMGQAGAPSLKKLIYWLIEMTGENLVMESKIIFCI